jgi:hypothetical protein
MKKKKRAFGEEADKRAYPTNKDWDELCNMKIKK